MTLIKCDICKTENGFCERSYPSGSYNDTFIDVGAGFNDYYSAFATHFIPDDKILNIFKKKCDDDHLNRPLKAYLTENDDWVVPQYSYRGCSEACILMLAYKALKVQRTKINISAYQKQTHSSDDFIKTRIEKYGLKAITFSADRENALNFFFKQITFFGRCIVPINDEVTEGHVVVLDQVFKERQTVRISEPFHAWQIEIPSDYFLKMVNYANLCFQIEENRSIEGKIAPLNDIESEDEEICSQYSNFTSQNSDYVSTQPNKEE